MTHHRFADLVNGPPAPASCPAAPAGFVLAPLFLCPAAGACSWQHHLYLLALQQAQDAARPSLLDRARQVVWN